MSRRVLYVDCFSGIAGDMMLGALLDLGLPLEHLNEQLGLLGLGAELQLDVRTAHRHGIGGVDVHVLSHGEPAEHSHPHPHPHDNDHHTHDAEAHAHQAHDHDHGHDHGRAWREIRALIERSEMGAGARAIALRIFEKLANAEARIHRVDAEDIHFHEVGSVDAIADICGVAIGLDWLGADQIISAPVPAPRGRVHCAHGRMPLPAPATLELLREVPLQPVDSEGEWVTPTGAAILSTVATGFGTIPAMRIDRIGYGVGDRDPPDRANLLRLILGERTGRSEDGDDLVIEANIDDMSAELFGHLVAALFSAGALDVYLTPIQMKKGRPGTQLSALCEARDRTVIIDTILRESTTIGVRFRSVERYKTVQTIETVTTPLGTVRVKVARDGERVMNRAPEYEDCRLLAEASGVPLKRVVQLVWSHIDPRPKKSSDLS